MEALHQDRRRLVQSEKRLAPGSSFCFGNIARAEESFSPFFMPPKHQTAARLFLGDFLLVCVGFFLLMAYIEVVAVRLLFGSPTYRFTRDF
jgi:hypothetical protein